MTDDKSIDGSSISIARHKIVLVGDVNVGKTSILTRFIDNTFQDIYDPSIGVDFFSKTIVFRDQQLKLQFWDSAGQEKYKSLIPSYVRGASIIFVVYDKSSKPSNLEKETFLNVPNWIKFLRGVQIGNSIIVLCGNKMDLESYCC